MMRRPQLVFLSPFLLAVWMILPVIGLARGIKVEVVPSKLTPAPGEKITVAVNVDVSGTSELLGAISATLTWNKDVLRYLDHSGGKTEGFAKPVANHQKASEGRLVFASFNPYGGANAVNILNVSFEVIGAAGSAPDLQVEIKELVAARTFVNLMPYLQATIVGAAASFTVADIPKKYALNQNYPNPFNAGTEIQYALPEASHVRLEIYNSLGEKVKTLIDAPKEAGRHQVKWDGTNENGRVVSSGTYIYRLKAGGVTAERKMQFVK